MPIDAGIPFLNYDAEIAAIIPPLLLQIQLNVAHAIYHGTSLRCLWDGTVRYTS